MTEFKKTLSDLQNDTVKVMQCLSKLFVSESNSGTVVEKKIDDYLCELEGLCIKSRGALDRFRTSGIVSEKYIYDKTVTDICGDIDVTYNGWLHITLNSLLPSCKYSLNRLNIICIEVYYTKGFSNFVFEHIVKVIRR